MTGTLEPFVARAKLLGPISLEDPIPFEGILFDARFRSDPTTFGQPMACLAQERGIYRASCSVLVTQGLAGALFSTVPVTKRIDLRNHARTKIDTGADVRDADLQIGEMSPMRPSLNRHPAISNVVEVVWQGFGDVDAVRRLVEDVPSVGRLRQRGMGQVVSWDVAPCDADPSDAGWFSGDRLIRRMPLDMVTERLGAVPETVMSHMEALEPPFWARDEKIRVGTPTLRSTIMTRGEARTLFGF